MRSSDTASRPVDILIAEDDAPLRTSLRMLLEQQGYTCAEAQNGSEAVDLARSASPRCVLLDVGMPGMDGFAVARHLRSDPRTRETRIHFLTGRTDLTAQEQAQRAGCEALMNKPVDVEALTKLVERLLDPNTAGTSGLTKTQAEELLDWLEANGHPTGELSYRPWEGFGVRWPRGA
jgi:CheY-like chemotaxis protein